jgi:hypothetical protein
MNYCNFKEFLLEKSEIFKKDALLPNKFLPPSLTIRSFNAIETSVRKTLKAEGYDRLLIKQLLSFMTAAHEGATEVEIIYDFSAEDLKTITVEFGEILCALYILRDPKIAQITFPESKIHKLIDFYVKIEQQSYEFTFPYSVKSGNSTKSHAPTLSNLKDQKVLDQLDILYPELKSSRERLILDTIIEQSRKDTILILAKKYKVKGYELIDKIDTKEGIKNYDKFKPQFIEWYRSLGPTQEENLKDPEFDLSISKVLSSYEYQVSLVINQDEALVKYLNMAVKLLRIREIVCTLKRKRGKNAKYTIDFLQKKPKSTNVVASFARGGSTNKIGFSLNLVESAVEL